MSTKGSESITLETAERKEELSPWREVWYLRATSSVSPDASCFDVSDESGMIGFAPVVEEGPRKEANFLVAFDTDSEMVGPSASFGVEPASRDDAPKVKGDVVPPVDPNPEKLPNLCGAAGCW